MERPDPRQVAGNALRVQAIAARTACSTPDARIVVARAESGRPAL
ncbi:hypothetical protein [Sphingomonas sp. CFBP 8760]|nr:hypothetical protein [Sphingomonas sp. CFBP 8760]